MPATEWTVLATGIVGTWLGAELLVRGSAHLALGLGVRPLVVGLTVVAFGTSSPEAVVSFLAAIQGAQGIAVGNVVGSNIANIGLILAVLALLRPISIHWRQVRIDVGLLLVATVASGLLLLDGQVSRRDGAILLLLLVAYLVYYMLTRHTPPTREDVDLQAEARKSPHLGAATFQTVLGLAILIGGATALLHAAQNLARHFGIPEEVIGATMVAVGTSLPELAASVVAVLRGHHEIGVGNIVGSNVMNLLFVLGGVATIEPFAVGSRVLLFLLPVMVAYTLALVVMMRSGRRVSRLEGAVLLLSYVLFAIAVY